MIKLVEHGKLLEAKKGAKRFPIRIITEGSGTSGKYVREQLERDASILANRPMFFNHPRDPERPWERDVEKIAAKSSDVEYKVVDGVAGLYTEAIVEDERRAAWLQEFADVLDISIYVAGTGEETEDGSVLVESFIEDPYNSIDFVVAGGRGGKVLRATESYREIENSIVEDGNKPSSEASEQEKEKAKNMEEKIQELIESLKPLTEFVADQKRIAEESKNGPTDVEEAVAQFAAAVKVIDEAELFDSQKEALREAAQKGEDIVPLLESAKKVHDEALGEVTRLSEGRYVEGASFDYKIAGLN